ncbi:hypothetical protein SJI19_05820 [Acerihabitans sp. TG2]|uniref:hypothetical protein n=1 Tax=Acerihabitans sp. TG2 TaxID=3096008 RepID=UPI002B2390AA|nr:hypothetical protein [Acerihabitans sp. TG2]MEA9390072.1 hypothetical protein [Acerihabitans sp. TG2]
MDCGQIIISGAVGMAAWFFLTKINAKWHIGKVTVSILTLVAIALWNTIAVDYLFSNNNKKEMRNFEQAMADIPMYQTIKKYEPTLYSSMLESAVSLKKNGSSRQQIIDMLQLKHASILLARIRYATDDTLIEHVAVNLQQIQKLYVQKEQKCFKYLFPQLDGGIDPVQLLPLNIMQRRMAVDNALIIASYETPRTINTQQDDAMAQHELSLIFQQMLLLYGQDITMLDAPADPNSDREKICEMTIDLYQRVLKLPAKQSSSVLRTMLTN